MSFGQPPNQGGWGPPPHQPQPGGFGPPPGAPPGGGGYGGPPMQPNAPVPINADLAFIVGLIVAMFCGCLPGGLLAVYFADQAKKAARLGNRPEAESKLRTSYIISGVSLGIMALIPCLYFAFVFFVAGAGAIAG